VVEYGTVAAFYKKPGKDQGSTPFQLKAVKMPADILWREFDSRLLPFMLTEKWIKRIKLWC
jgi:hypothetical protein